MIFAVSLHLTTQELFYNLVYPNPILLIFGLSPTIHNTKIVWTANKTRPVWCLTKSHGICTRWIVPYKVFGVYIVRSRTIWPYMENYSIRRIQSICHSWNSFFDVVPLFSRKHLEILLKVSLLNLNIYKKTPNHFFKQEKGLT